MKVPNIIYEDNDIIVCYKPSGMATQTRRIGQQDMESFIRNYRAAKKEPSYVGIVHRLDQPVEGVMVFAKNQKAAASLSRQIKEHTTEKYYYAASYGRKNISTDNTKNIDDKHADGKAESDSLICTLTDYISFDRRTNISKIVTANAPQSKKAVLEYKIVQPTDNVSVETQITVFDIKLLTGRHHQIRLQLANIGYPLIGDTKYGGENAERQQLALCSYKIVFDHPANGKRMKFEIEPQNRFLKQLTTFA